jgi:transcriptional regulator with XRE-family HTH domain
VQTLLATPAERPSALRTVRERAGLSQSELAELAGCDRATVSRLESSPRFTPALVRISTALDAYTYVNGGAGRD